MFEQYKGLRRENYILCFGRLVTRLGSMIWPMMTLILSEKMGVSAEHISWLLSAAMIVLAPAIYIGGKIADSTDKKKTIIMFDCISVICFVICAFIPMSWTAIGLLFMGSVFQNMENPAYGALVADITLTKDRDRAFSLQYLCSNLGLVLAPTVAGLLFRDHLWLAFLINGISIFASTMLIFFFVQDTTPCTETGSVADYQKDRSGESVLRILKDNPVIILFFAVMGGYSAAYQMYTYLMPLDLAAIHGDSGALIYGTVTSVNCIVVVLFTPVINRYFSEKSEPARITAGVFLLAAAYMMFVRYEGIIPVYYISMTILTWGEVIALTAQSPYLTRRIPSSHRGRLGGAMTVTTTAFTSIFQLAIGAVYGAGGSHMSWMVSIGLGFLTVLAGLLMTLLDSRSYPELYSKGSRSS